MGGIAVVGGYLVGSGEAELGNVATVETILIVVTVFGAGLLKPRKLGDPLLESFGAVFQVYGPPGVVGLLVGSMLGTTLARTSVAVDESAEALPVPVARRRGNAASSKAGPFRVIAAQSAPQARACA